MSDLISREYITGKICGLFSDGEKVNDKDKVINEVMDIIDNAPTIPNEYMRGYEAAEREYKRPQGEWIYGEDECGQDGWFCSECEFFVPWYYQYYEKDIDFIRDYKVCPHCLAEMVTYTGKDRDTRGGTE